MSQPGPRTPCWSHRHVHQGGLSGSRTRVPHGQQEGLWSHPGWTSLPQTRGLWWELPPGVRRPCFQASPVLTCKPQGTLTWPPARGSQGNLSRPACISSNFPAPQHPEVAPQWHPYRGQHWAPQSPRGRTAALGCARPSAQPSGLANPVLALEARPSRPGPVPGGGGQAAQWALTALATRHEPQFTAEGAGKEQNNPRG